MKTVIFDFDGTLTYKSPNIWQAIWKDLGYDTGKSSYYASLFTRFISGDIKHQEWCNLTCEAFKDRNMNKSQLEELAKDIKLIDNAEDVFKLLRDLGFSLHIVSGNIKTVISQVLGNKIKYFDTINANQFEFDNNGRLTYIEGTNYDFIGKANFINEYKEKTGTPAKDIIFVGNGDNDEWAHLSGCKTLCINPDDETDENNITKWHNVLHNVTDLRQILPEILSKKDYFSAKEEHIL